MKRIVTFVAPLAPVDSPQPDQDRQAIGVLSESSGEGALDGRCASRGAMKLEVVVSDLQANLIINSMLEHGSTWGDGAGDPRRRGQEESAIELLVQAELQNGEGGSRDLLERIVKRVERQLIAKVYADCDYVKSRAAARLGINRNTLLKKLREFGDVADDEGDAAGPDERPDETSICGA